MDEHTQDAIQAVVTSLESLKASLDHLCATEFTSPAEKRARISDEEYLSMALTPIEEVETWTDWALNELRTNGLEVPTPPTTKNLINALNKENAEGANVMALLRANLEKWRAWAIEQQVCESTASDDTFRRALSLRIMTLELRA